MGSTEDRGDDYQEPLVAEIHEWVLFQNGFMALRRASCATTLIWAAFTIICGMRGNLLAAILGFLVWLIIAHTIGVGQRALAIAIETEEERREARENYERLSNDLCLRELKKGKRHERG